MSMTDPIADALTRIRNALRIDRSTVKIPGSKIIRNVLETLRREGYIHGFQDVGGLAAQGMIEVELKYGSEGEHVIQHLERVSKPGRRTYTSISDLKPVINGLGIHVLSTSKGVLSDREARVQNVGGELICTIW